MLAIVPEIVAAIVAERKDVKELSLDFGVRKLKGREEGLVEIVWLFCVGISPIHVATCGLLDHYFINIYGGRFDKVFLFLFLFQFGPHICILVFWPFFCILVFGHSFVG